MPTPKEVASYARMCSDFDGTTVGGGHVARRGREPQRTFESPRLPRAITTIAVLLALYGGLLMASPASATPLRDILACGDTDAPVPASPYGDGSFIARPATAVTDLPEGWKPGEIDDATDPFRNADEVSLESVYGTAPQWWTYDTGCAGQFVAGAGTALANIELQISGILPSWSHALLDTVIGDSDLFAVLDTPIKATTEAVSNAVWEPWLPVAMLVVGGLVLWRARSGRLGGAVTAAGTALGVLALTSMLIQYPAESVDMVDDGVRTATGLIAAGFTGDQVQPEDSPTDDPGTAAVDAQMDDIVRTTQYRTWANGVFGDPDSDTARTYGPRVFRSTHFSWAEYEVYGNDPTGEGKQILEAKQKAFKEHAEDIKRIDPVAYEHFKGTEWGSRATSALVNLVVVCIPCLFLLLAGLIAVMGFVLIRLVVPLAPAGGVIFLFDTTRDVAVDWLKRVVGPLVMGPICFLTALVLLRFTSAILEADEMWWILKIGLITVLTAIAWRLARPLGVIPGMERLRSRMVGALGLALGTAVGAAQETRDKRQDETTYGDQRIAGIAQRPGLEASPGGVYHPAFETRSSGVIASEPTEDFVPYLPPPRELGSVASSAGAVAAAHASGAEAKAQYAWPIGPHPLVRARDKFPPPAVSRTVSVGPLGPRTTFPPKNLELEPNTAYTVSGRGTYYTDDQSEVGYVDTEFGGKGSLNWDLNYPKPGATYVVGNRFVYKTDPETRTIRAIDVQAARGNADRSESVQASVGRAGGKGYDGGHLHQNAHAGGAERINIVAMLQELNRSGTTEFGSIPNSFYAFESELRDMVDAGRNVSVDLHVRYPKDSADRTPTMIRAVYTVDGGRPMRRTFENVRDE